MIVVKSAISRSVSVIANPYKIQEWIRNTAGTSLVALINIALHGAANMFRG
jgi:hypothetical protein